MTDTPNTFIRPLQADGKAEALVDISEGFWLITATHVRVADRAIGARTGTGGTSGVSYLEEALKLKAFPELWDVRTRL